MTNLTISTAALLCLGASLPTAAATVPRLEVVSRAALPAARAPSSEFDGAVDVQPLMSAVAPSRVSGTAVVFRPGARSNWHTHPLGQLVIVTAGRGYVQAWGGPLQEIKEGDLVRIPPGMKHWHGARPNESMSQITIQEALRSQSTAWLEKVTDAQYDGGTSTRPH